jgi:hypothetical protein
LIFKTMLLTGVHSGRNHTIPVRGVAVRVSFDSLP